MHAPWLLKSCDFGKWIDYPSESRVVCELITHDRKQDALSGISSLDR